MAVTRYLEGNITLTQLDWASSGELGRLNDTITLALASALSNHPAIEELTFDGCAFGRNHSTFTTILESVMNIKSVAILEDNELDKQCIETITRVLALNPRMEWFHIGEEHRHHRRQSNDKCNEVQHPSQEIIL